MSANDDPRDYASSPCGAHEFEERLRLLNRGQRWVSRKITELMPAVDDPALRDALTEMRETHDRNVLHLDSVLAVSSRGG